MATNKYIQAVGRRKTSVARVRITPASETLVTVNEREFDNYFPTVELRTIALSPLADLPNKYTITAKLTGGGVSSQAQALRHGIARAVIADEPELRTKLKTAGYLKRDPRSVERKKFGLKKARKAPTWSKR